MPSASEEEKYLESLNSAVQNARGALDAIKSQLGAETFDDNSHSKYLRTGRDPEMHAASREVANLYRSTSELVADLERRVASYEDTWRLDRQHEEDLRASLRIDRWKDWFQRYVRWTIGIFAAVTIYSTVVWMSEKTDFFKVPIRDILFYETTE